MSPRRSSTSAEPAPRPSPGRPRNAALDDVILDSTLAVLAESGYERMTIDQVAAHASTARATVYRRWATKADLVLAAVARLTRADVDLASLPDTGELRADMVAMIRPFDDADQQDRIRAVVGLLAVAAADDRLAAAAGDAGVAQWTEANRILIRRAVERGEYPAPTDLDLLAQVIPLCCIARAAQRLPIDREFCLGLIDGVVLPALRGH